MAEKKQQNKKESKQAKALERKAREINFEKVTRKAYEDSKKIKIAPKDSIISLQHINKIYPNLVQAVFDFNLEIKDKEFIVFVGPSGCGKSTTLRMVAGLEEITAGDLYINRKYANDTLPKDRNISMVFQSYALYPNMTVRENLAFGLKIKHLKKEEINERVESAAKILEISDYLDRKPSALSGGQRQRVALGRAIVKASPVFLMDEPLSNLDAKLRVQMRSEIVSLHKRVGSTTIYVTHDQIEAMTMADRIVVMSKGRVQQIGTPAEVYSRPNNLFVATFIGAPAMNICDAEYDKGVINFSDGYSLKLSKERIANVENFVAEQIKKYTDLVNQDIASIRERIQYLTFKSVKYRVDNLDKLERRYASRENILRTNIANLTMAYENGDTNGTKEGIEEMNAKLKMVLKQKEYEKKSILASSEKMAAADVVNAKSSSYKDLVNQLMKSDEEIAVYKKNIANYKKKIIYYKEIQDNKKMEIKFGIRPEDIKTLSGREVVDKPTKPFDAEVVFVELLGYEYYIYFMCNGVKFVSKAANGKYVYQTNVTEQFVFDETKIHAFDKESEEILF